LFSEPLTCGLLFSEPGRVGPDVRAFILDFGWPIWDSDAKSEIQNPSDTR
jgi:hypothetical protein